MLAGDNSRLFLMGEVIMHRVFDGRVKRRTKDVGGHVLIVAALGQKTFTMPGQAPHSAKMLCSGVLMAGMNEERLKREQL
jgi:hypothetical protein